MDRGESDAEVVDEREDNVTQTSDNIDSGQNKRQRTDRPDRPEEDVLNDKQH